MTRGAYTVTLGEMVTQHGYTLPLSDYPIFDEDYRSELNGVIFNHFYFREIGFETPEMFNNRLSHRMRLIMPSFNLLYRAMEEEVNPLTNMFFRTTGKVIGMGDIKRIGSANLKSNDDVLALATSIGTDTTNSDTDVTREAVAKSLTEGSARGRSVGSNFPQMMLSGNEDYASEGSDSVSESKSDVNSDETISETTGSVSASSSEDTSERDEKRTIKSDTEMTDDVSRSDTTDTVSTTLGRNLSLSDMFTKTANTILTVDYQVMQALEPLFMQLWDTNEEYSHHPGQPMLPYYAFHPYGMYY